MEMKQPYTSNCLLWLLSCKGLCTASFQNYVCLLTGLWWGVKMCLSYNIPVCNNPSTTSLTIIVTIAGFNHRECHLHVETIQMFFSVCESAKSSEAEVCPWLSFIVLYRMKREPNSLSFCTGNRIMHVIFHFEKIFNNPI